MFGFGFVDVAGVPGRELDGPLGCDPGLELAGAFELGIELGTEEQGNVGLSTTTARTR